MWFGGHYAISHIPYIQKFYSFYIYTSIWSKPFYVQHKKRYESNKTQTGWIYLKVSYLVSSESGSSESGKLRAKQRKVLIYQFPFAVSLFWFNSRAWVCLVFYLGVLGGGRRCVCNSSDKKVETKMIKMNLGVRWGNSKSVRQLETDAFITPHSSLLFCFSSQSRSRGGQQYCFLWF